jgi:hypothetical protein
MSLNNPFIVGNLHVLGSIQFADQSVQNSSNTNLTDRVLGISRDSLNGITSINSDNFIVEKTFSVNEKITTPNVLLQNVTFMNDFDENGLPVVQSRGFSNVLRDKILEASTELNSIIPDIIEPPIKKAKLNEAAFENVNFATSIVPNNIAIESKIDSSFISFEPSQIYLRNATADTATISTDINGNLNFSISDGLVKSQANLDLSNNNIINVNTITANNLTGTASSINVISDNSAGTYYVPFAKTSGTGSKSLFLDDDTGPLTYNPSSSTLNVGNLVATSLTGNLNGSITGNAQTITATSDNTSGTYFLPFTKVSGTGSKSFFIDDTTGPLTYNPSTGTLNCTNFSGIASNATNVNVVATNTTAGTYYPVFAVSASGNTPMRTDTALTYNPSTDTFSASNGNFATLNTPVVQNTSGNLDLRVSTTLNSGVGGALLLTGGTGLLSASSGGSSGRHLVIQINGTTYKIPLQNI